MKKYLTLLLILTPVFSFADDSFLKGMVQGHFLLVGKAPDSDKTYHGKVKIEEKNGALVVTRQIENKTVTGSAAIELTMAEARVLRIRFSENNVSYEETCMIGSDLDNYARISCYLYQPGVETNQPGLEVLFNDHTAD